MSTEPQWPTVQDVFANEVNSRGFARTEAEVIARAVDMCREAWRLANDDPAAAPIGEVRRDPENGATGQSIVILMHHSSPNCWRVMGTANVGYTHEIVTGWPVIGIVPGMQADS